MAAISEYSCLFDENNHLYEILPPEQPVRPYFDLEIDGATDHNLRLELFLGWLEDLFISEFDVKPEPLIINSCRENKLSYHVILTNCHVESVAALKEFVQWMFETMQMNPVAELAWMYKGKEQRFIFDKIPYGSNQCFRMVNQSKIGKTHVLKCDAQPLDAMVRGTTGRRLCLQKYAKKTPKSQPLESQELSELREEFLGYYNDHLLDKVALEGTWEDWRNMSFALFNTFQKEGRDLFVMFSKINTEKYDEKTTMYHYDHLSLGGDRRITFKTIRSWARQAAGNGMTKAEQAYTEFKRKHETDFGLAFIKKIISYAYKIDGVVCFFNEAQMRQLLATEQFEEKLLFSKWCSDPSRKTYNDIGVYPHDVKPVEGNLNLWTGFAVEQQEYPEVGIEPILKHVDSLANHDPKCKDFILKWLANLFQYPSSTSIFISISGAEGCGKSMFVEMIMQMVGADKSAEITDMSSQLFGSFNSQYRDTVLMNINEVERHDASKCYEKLKAQITSPTVQVHGKGEKPFTINNNRKFISTNNNHQAIVIKEGNRRYCAFECSNELVGDVKYFKDFVASNTPALRYTFWKYLMAYETPKQLTVVDIPVTELMKEAYQLNRDPLEDFVEELPGKEKLYMDNLYEKYQQHMKRNGMEYKLNGKQFAMKLNRVVAHRLEKKGQNDCLDASGEHDRRRYLILKEMEAVL